MRIVVEVLGSASSILPEGVKRATVDLPDGGTVGDAVAAAGVPDGAPWNAAIDGVLVYANTVLTDGAHVLLFSPIEGG